MEQKREGLFKNNKPRDQAPKLALETHLAAHHLIMGVAIDNGDCFFDAVAQTLFVAGKRTRRNVPFTIADLRAICSDQVRRLEEANKAQKKPNWIELNVDEDHKSGGPSYDYYRVNIAKPFSEISVGGIWGRPNIEGKIFCELLSIKLHVIQVKSNRQRNGYEIYHQLITAGGAQSVREEEAYNQEGMVLRIAVYENSFHFVPLFPGSK
jgi:hypothetical protein